MVLDVVDIDVNVAIIFKQKKRVALVLVVVVVNTLGCAPFHCGANSGHFQKDFETSMIPTSEGVSKVSEQANE